MNFRARYAVKPGTKVSLARHDPDDTGDFRDKEEAAKLLQKNLRRLGDLQNVLYAENRRALLIILQGMDAAGKDGTIRNVMTAMNPLGCHVTGFKVPSSE